MISRALEAEVPFAWFTADEAYGQAKWLQAWLEEHGMSYVMAIRRSDTLTLPTGIVLARECDHGTGLETARGPEPQ
jgi:SRSO17 transposase